MKVWIGFGSEHSMDLVIIGRFESYAKAETAVETVERLRELAESEWPDDFSWDPQDARMTQGVRDELNELGLYIMGRGDINHFAFDHSVTRDGAEVCITTEEIDIQGFVKVLLELGAKVEIYSAHNWNDDGTPRTPVDGTEQTAAE